MPKVMQDLIEQYIEAVKKIYGSHVRQIILYGSYARGDFRSDSDVDIMILLDLSDLELKAYRQQLSYMTYDFNMDHDLDIKPIAKSEAHFEYSNAIVHAFQGFRAPFSGKIVHIFPEQSAAFN